MAIEIDELVIHVTVTDVPGARAEPALDARLQQWRDEVLAECRELLAQARQRERER